MKNEALNPIAGSGSYAEPEELTGHIKALYGQEAAKAILFLLQRADADTEADFLCRHVFRENPARRTKVNIIIRPLERWLTTRGNLGHYMIYAQKGDEEERLLRFTNQASLVYYLMYLIDRSHHQSVSLHRAVTSSLSLKRNRKPFMGLYQRVYDIDSQKLAARYQRLLFREDHGAIRVGREAECIYDIRKHLQEVFTGYDECFFPYAMTARTHLSVPPEKIIFEGEAKTLLEFTFV